MTLSPRRGGERVASGKRVSDSECAVPLDHVRINVRALKGRKSKDEGDVVMNVASAFRFTFPRAPTGRETCGRLDQWRRDSLALAACHWLPSVRPCGAKKESHIR